MFGEDLIIGEKTYIIDYKKRLAIPKFTKAEIGDRLVIELQNDSFKLFLYDEYLELARRLVTYRNKATTYEEFERINAKIEEMCKNVSHVLRIAEQRRILLPTNTMEALELNTGDTVECKGLGKSLLVRKIK